MRGMLTLPNFICEKDSKAQVKTATVDVRIIIERFFTIVFPSFTSAAAFVMVAAKRDYSLQSGMFTRVGAVGVDLFGSGFAMRGRVLT